MKKEEVMEDILDKKSMNDFDKCAEWYFANAEEIEEKFSDKFIAITMPGVIKASDDLDKLMEELEKEGIDMRRTLITGIPKMGIASIL